MTTAKPTQAQLIAGYLKLTSAHYYLGMRHDPSPCLELRSLIAKDMDSTTLFMAQDIQCLLGGMYDGRVSA